MKRTFLSFVAIIVTACFTVSLVCAQAESRNSDVTLCPLTVPPSIKQASADFTVSYSFQLDEKGAPANLLKIRDEYVGKDEIMSCLADWHFKGFEEKTKVTAIFKWRHGRGWVEMLILGPKFTQTIRIKGGIGY